MNDYEHLAKKYAEQDKEIKRKAKQERLRRDNELKNEFLGIIAKNREVWNKTAEERRRLFGRSDEEENSRWINKDDFVEEVINVRKEKIIEPVISL